MNSALTRGFGHISTFGKNYGLMVLFLTLVAMGPAFAGTDNTFDSVVQMLTNWATGSLGKLIAIAAFIVGMGIGMIRQSVMAAVVGVAFALVMFYGPTIIGNIVTFAV